MKDLERTPTERVIKLEIIMERVMADLDDIKETLIEDRARSDSKFEMLVKLINDKEDRYNGKFATNDDMKWVKKVIYGTCAFIITAVGTLVLKSVHIL